MPEDTIDHRRIKRLNTQPVKKGNYVLYWMQQSQRAEDNPALEFAVLRANHLKLPLLAVFGLTSDYPEANLRHYLFMAEGLKETQATLAARGIQLLVQRGNPDDVALSLSRRAAMVVCDCGYLRHQKKWRQWVAAEASCAVFQVEGDVVVPLESVSGKAEWAARTLRPKLLRELASYLRPATSEALQCKENHLVKPGLSLEDPVKLCKTLGGTDGAGPVSSFFTGGTSQAKMRLKLFLEKKIDRYEKDHNQPQTDHTSLMSPYLHFGQISPQYLAIAIQKAHHADESARKAYLEQLIVRRELAMNYVHFHSAYDLFDGLPAWTRQTLREHSADNRPVQYDLSALESARTHDSYWNAAMNEMIYSGYMHNYMRMYWGKKILEWSGTPQLAFKHTLYLNNKYFLDGRDPNSYVGVAWIFGLHDRPWKERAIFGKVRYMAASGLERKCNMQAYKEKVDNIVAKAKNSYPDSSEYLTA